MGFLALKARIRAESDHPQCKSRPAPGYHYFLNSSQREGKGNYYTETWKLKSSSTEINSLAMDFKETMISPQPHPHILELIKPAEVERILNVTNYMPQSRDCFYHLIASNQWEGSSLQPSLLMAGWIAKTGSSVCKLLLHATTSARTLREQLKPPRLIHPRKLLFPTWPVLL